MVADLRVSLVEAEAADGADHDGEFQLDDDLVNLLDSVFLETLAVDVRPAGSDGPW